MLIQRYLARRLLSPVVGVFAFSVVVVAVFYLAQVLNWAASDGWPIQVVLAMAGLRLLLYFDVLIPVAVLVGMVVGLGRIHQANELVALASVGVGRGRLISMMMGWMLLFALLVALISMVVRPWGYGQIYDIEAALADRLDITQVEPGRFQVGDASWLLYAKERHNNELRDVFVHQLRKDGRGLLTAETLTQQAEQTGLTRLILRGDVSSYLMTQAKTHGLHSSSRPIIGHFDQLDVLVETQPLPVRDKIRRALPMSALFGADQAIEHAELQWRWVTPISVLALFWLAMVLVSSKPRAQRAIAIFAALIAGTLYFSALGVLVKWVEQGQVGFFPGVFAAPMVLIVGLILLSLARRWVPRWSQ